MPFDPLNGMDPDGRITRPQIPDDVPHPERWRYTPEARMKPGSVFDRFLVSSFISPILFREKDIGFGGGVALTDVDFRDQRYREFANILATYSEGMAKFAVIMEPNGTNIPGASDPVIQLACLDASLAMAPVFKRFRSVIITSGTLSPIDLYPKLLQFEPCVSESFSMSTFRPCIRPLMISRGSDQLAVSTRFEDRGDMGVVRNYGSMLVELCAVIPDGVVAFFTSYSYMESLISEWDAIGILRELTKYKLVFIETKDVVETTLALDNYRLACDCGRGAVFLSVARGKVSERKCGRVSFVP